MPKKGEHLSEEAKQKIRIAHLGKSNNHKPDCSCPWCQAKRGDAKGENNKFFGKKHSDKTKQKIREKALINNAGENNPMFGKHFSEESKQKNREHQLGKMPWNKGKTGIYSEETKQKMRAHNAHYWKGKHFSKKTKEKMRKPKSELHKQHVSEASKRRWNNMEYVQKIVKSLNIKPNKKELLLDSILHENFPNEWRYVGDGNTIINGLCPDFINCNGAKKIIELFGEYWHDKKGNVRYRQTEEGRKKVFNEIGYDMLVIWEYELSDEQKVIEKIRKFTENNSMEPQDE